MNERIRNGIPDVFGVPFFCFLAQKNGKNDALLPNSAGDMSADG